MFLFYNTKNSEGSKAEFKKVWHFSMKNRNYVLLTVTAVLNISDFYKIGVSLNLL